MIEAGGRGEAGGGALRAPASTFSGGGWGGTTPLPPAPPQILLRLLFFNDTATTEIYTLSLHDALPISQRRRGQRRDEQHGQLARAGLVGHEVAVDRALRRLLDDRGGRAAQVGEVASRDAVVHVRGGVGELSGVREREHGSGR